MSHAEASAALAAFVADPPDIPGPVLEDARRSVLDGLGSLLAGSLEPPARIPQDLVRDCAAAAALANGVATHIPELDDIHKGSTVPAAASVIPAALAVAEREHQGGAVFLRAVVLGYEVRLVPFVPGGGGRRAGSGRRGGRRAVRTAEAVERCRQLRERAVAAHIAQAPPLESEARRPGVPVVLETFPERASLRDGRLAPRSMPGSGSHVPGPSAPEVPA